MSDEAAEAEIVAIPSDRAWLDPLLINVMFTIQVDEIPLPGGSPILILPASPRRWAFGVMCGVATANPALSPWGNPGAFPFFDSLGETGAVWAKMFDYGPLIQSSWYAENGAPVTIRVVQILRNT